MEISFENKVALVTGAGSGMGLVTAKAFAESGAAVVLGDHHFESVDIASKQLVAQGHKALACMKYELRQMRKQGSGAIVNNSSLGGLVGLPGRAIYHASKHGVLGLTKSAALEYAARGISINAICPGTIDTPMVAEMVAKDPEAMKEILKEQTIGRLGKPEEIASAVLWLCSPGAGFVIGHALAIDGGFTVH